MVLESGVKPWESSYVTNRHQFVRFDRVKSELLAVKSGVLRGSIVGPLFFIIFINDLVREIEHSLPYLFADDLKLLQTNLTGIENDLLKFEIWVAKNGMDLQLTKCHLLNFKPQTLSIELYGESLTDLSLNCQRSWNSDQEQFIFPRSFE